MYVLKDALTSDSSEIKAPKNMKMSIASSSSTINKTGSKDSSVLAVKQYIAIRDNANDDDVSTVYDTTTTATTTTGGSSSSSDNVAVGTVEKY